MEIRKKIMIALWGAIFLVILIIGLVFIKPSDDHSANTNMTELDYQRIFDDFVKPTEEETYSSDFETYENIVINNDKRVTEALIQNDFSGLSAFKEGDIIYSNEAGGYYKIITDENGSKSVTVPLAREVFNKLDIELNLELKPEDISIDGAIIESSDVSYNGTNLFASIGNENYSGLKKTITEQVKYYSPKGKFSGSIIKLVEENKLREIRVQGYMEVYTFDEDGDKNGSFSQELDFSLFNMKYKYKLLKQESINWFDDPDILLEYHLDYDYENRIEMNLKGDVDAKLLLPFRINPNGTVTVTEKGVKALPSLIIKPQAGFNGEVTINGKISSNQAGHAFIEFFAMTGEFNREAIKGVFYNTGKTNVIDTKAVSVFYNMKVKPTLEYAHANVNVSLNSIFGVGIENEIMLSNTKLIEFSLYAGEKIDGEASGSIVWNLLEAPKASSLTSREIYKEVATIYPVASVSLDFYHAIYIDWNIFDAFEGDKTIALNQPKPLYEKSDNWNYDIYQFFKKNDELPKLVHKIDNDSVIASLLFTNYSFGNLALSNNLSNIHANNYDNYLSIEAVESQIEAVSTNNDLLNISENADNGFGKYFVNGLIYDGEKFNLVFSYNLSDSRVYEVLVKRTNIISAEEENRKKDLQAIISFLESEMKGSGGSYDFILSDAYLSFGMADEALKVLNNYANEVSGEKAEDLRNSDWMDDELLDRVINKTVNLDYNYDTFLIMTSTASGKYSPNPTDANLAFTKRAFDALKDTPVGDDFKAILDANETRLNEATTLKLKAKEAAKKYDVILDNGIYTAFTRFNPKPLSGVGSWENPYIFESEFNVEILLPYYDQILKSGEFDTLDCDYGRNIWGLAVVGVQTNDGYLIKNHFKPLFINQSYSVGAQNRDNSGTFYEEFSGFVYTIKKGEPKANVDYSVDLEVLDREYYDGIVYTENVKILIKLKPSYKDYTAAGKGLPLGVYWMGVHDEIDLMDYLNDKKGPWYGSVYNPTYSEELGGIVITVDDFVNYISIAGKRLNFTLDK